MQTQGETIMTTKYLFTILAALILTMPMTAMAGDLEPIAGPDDNSTAMYTLEDLYDYLDSGVAGTKRTGGFTEPGAGPGQTGYTIDEIMSVMPEKDNTNGASPADVAIGKTFWGLKDGVEWGEQTGTYESITCSGTLNGTRWCDQGDGTVKDMTTGLIWLKNANCFGTKKWIDTSTWDDAQTSSGTLNNGTCGLTDGSVEGDWRLPTKTELYNLAHCTQAVRERCFRAFTGVQYTYYKTSTTDAADTDVAWVVDMSNGYASTYYSKVYSYNYVWPVRSDN
jgi:hypothetical protein